MVPAIRPGAPQMPNFYMPVIQRPTQQGQRFGNRRMMPMQQQLPNIPPVPQHLPQQVMFI